jgi:hypothetical protein
MSLSELFRERLQDSRLPDRGPRHALCAWWGGEAGRTNSAPREAEPDSTPHARRSEAQPREDAV